MKATWLVLAAALAAPSTLAGDGGVTAGRWRLVEQRYEGGGYNFGDRLPETRLVITADGRASLETPAWRGAWPAWLGPDGPAPLAEPAAVRITPAALAADYRVAAAPGDDTEIRVREECVLAEGDRLRCTLAVRLVAAGGREAGGFTWTRLFARETAP